MHRLLLLSMIVMLLAVQSDTQDDDGEALLFPYVTWTQETGCDVHMMNVDTDEVILSHVIVDYYCWGLSPNGEWIIIRESPNSDVSELSNFYLYHIPTETLQQLPHSNIRRVRWSLNNQKIAYIADNVDFEGDIALYTYNIETGQSTKIIDEDVLQLEWVNDELLYLTVNGLSITVAHGENIYQIDLPENAMIPLSTFYSIHGNYIVYGFPAPDLEKTNYISEAYLYMVSLDTKEHSQVSDSVVSFSDISISPYDTRFAYVVWDIEIDHPVIHVYDPYSQEVFIKDIGYHRSPLFYRPLRIQFSPSKHYLTVFDFQGAGTHNQADTIRLINLETSEMTHIDYINSGDSRGSVRWLDATRFIYRDTGHPRNAPINNGLIIYDVMQETYTRLVEASDIR